MSPAIEVTHFGRSYGTTKAVQDLTFSVDDGTILGLLGPNGAGKTTTVEVLEGYLSPSTGTVRVLGKDPFRNQRVLSREVGVLLQEGGIPPRMTARQALGLYTGFYANPVPVEELVDRLDLGRILKAPYRRLSGGEKQRLLLALALIGRPKVLFLDEPTVGVDPEGKVIVRELLSHLRNDGVAMVVTSHELDEIERIVDDVLIIQAGQERARGTVDELCRGFGRGHIEVSLVHECDVDSLARAIGYEIVAENPLVMKIQAEPTPAVMGRLSTELAARSIQAEAIRTVSTSLEQVYLDLVSGAHG